MSGNSSALVTISPESQVIVFSGNLLKAPPLNRRGRKKWHERYFLLRANKTIEIHKSRRAAEAQKTPRRVIDLRECISLELGLEYKNLQHILSLGTFKRTFFLGAPSDALMLQWGNVLEKVKGAVSGETIEVLDIGLRNTRNHNAVHRVKPSETTRAHSSTPSSPKKMWGHLYQKGASKSSYAISNFDKDVANAAYGSRGSGSVGYTSYYTSPNNRSSAMSSQEAYSPGHRQEMLAYGHPQMADTSIETVDLRERGRLSRTSSSTSSSGPSPLHPPLSGKIPPPNIMLNRWRGSGNEGSPKHGEDNTLQDDEVAQRDKRWQRFNGRERAPRGDAMLHRSEAFRSLASKQAANGDMGGVWRGRRRSEDTVSHRRVQNDGSSSPALSNPLKQSRHYRKIELQAEKPLFGLREDDELSSDEERDSVVSETTGTNNAGVVPMSTAFPGKPYHMLGRDHYQQQQPLSVPARLELHGRRRNYSGPPISGRRSGGYGYPSGRNRDRLESGGRGYFGGSGGSGWVGNESRRGNISPFDDGGTELPPRPNFMNRPRPLVKEVASHKFYSLESLERSLQEDKANTYCQVTVGARNADSASDITSSRTGISNAKLENILSKSSASSLDYDLHLPSPISPNTSSLYEEEEEEEICLSPPLSPLLDEPGSFRLPAQVSESYLYRSSGSMKSPINEILAPPPSFEDIHTTQQSSVLNETISEEAEPQTSESGRESQRSKSSAVASDRRSTESGYTSGQGQSPGVNDRRNLTTVEEFAKAEAEVQNQSMEHESNLGESTEDVLSDLSASSIRNSQSGYSVRNSQTSYASTDSIRCYVPLVFQKSGKAYEEEPSSLFVVVCLVENSEALIKELLSLKVSGGYKPVECEGEVGKNVVNAGDDFTVETALEDLEFGFSITTSKQKDVYINRAKVREFQFKIDNLFGCSGKPFSCDVEIRQADQLTVLPIEIECAR